MTELEAWRAHRAVVAEQRLSVIASIAAILGLSLGLWGAIWCAVWWSLK